MFKFFSPSCLIKNTIEEITLFNPLVRVIAFIYILSYITLEELTIKGGLNK